MGREGSICGRSLQRYSPKKKGGKKDDGNGTMPVISVEMWNQLNKNGMSGLTWPYAYNTVRCRHGERDIPESLEVEVCVARAD